MVAAAAIAASRTDGRASRGRPEPARAGLTACSVLM
jgi:hypothetical protein